MDNTEKRMADIRIAIQEDIDDLEQAVKLIEKVNETFSSAFWDHAGKEPVSTNCSNASIASKLYRSSTDIKMITQVLKLFKEGY